MFINQHTNNPSSRMLRERERLMLKRQRHDVIIKAVEKRQRRLAKRANRMGPGNGYEGGKPDT